MHQNEVIRIYKSVNDHYIEPISFIVPRRAETFQDDIYPPTIGLKSAMSPSEWLGGKEAIPPKISMASLFDGSGIQEVTAAQEKPSTATSAPPPKSVAEVKNPEPVPTPTPVARPSPPMKEQGESMAAMVNKFVDEDDEDDEDEDDHQPDEIDDTSSFEEVTKPTERVPTSIPSPEKVDIPVEIVEPPVEAPIFSQAAAPSKSTTSSTPPTIIASGGSSFHDEMQEIKALISEQTKTIASQAQQVQNLTAEIEALKAKLP